MTDPVFELFIAFQIGEVGPEDLKSLVWFLAPLIHQVILNKYLTHVPDIKAFKNMSHRNIY